MGGCVALGPPAVVDGWEGGGNGRDCGTGVGGAELVIGRRLEQPAIAKRTTHSAIKQPEPERKAEPLPQGGAEPIL